MKNLISPNVILPFPPNFHKKITNTDKTIDGKPMSQLNYGKLYITLDFSHPDTLPNESVKVVG